MNRIIHFLFLCIFFSCSISIRAQLDYMHQWPQFRGPYASGIVESKNLPDKWDINTGENIKWKIKIPGLGNSSPVIWDDKIFVTTAINMSGSDSLKAGLYGDIDNVNDTSIHELRLLCIDKYSGKVLWNELAYNDIPKTKRHTKASHADPTPATNGEYVVAFFGSNGLYCYDFEGHLKWKKDFSKMNAGYFETRDMEWDVSSSPIIHENAVIVQCDNLDEGFLTAIDLETGVEKWRIPRKDVSTYSSPNFYTINDSKHIVVNGFNHIGAYDFYTGKEIWKLKGGGDIPVPSPFFANGLIYIHSAHGVSSPIYAIKQEAKGDISLSNDSTFNQYIAWSTKRGAAYIPTDIVYKDILYNLSDWSGKLTCYDANTGKILYSEKIKGAEAITASGIASNDKIYYTVENGKVFIIKAGKQFEIEAINDLGETILATPAISEDMLFFRTQHSLIAVGK